MDYAAPIEQDMAVRFINRHRLEKKDPTAEVSEAVEPIIYYLDNGTQSRYDQPCWMVLAGGIKPLRL